MKLGDWLNEYDREVRLVPALLAALPLAFAAVGLGLAGNPLVGTVVGALIAVGAPLFVAKQVGNRGRQLEEELFEKWGGPPTTLLLLPAAGAPIGGVRAQRRDRLEKLTGHSLPRDADLDAIGADQYRAATLWLITNTRDHAKFPVVWTELKAYGFERNLLGIRPVGLAACLSASAALAAGVVAGLFGAHVAVLPCAMLCLASLLAGLLWWRIPGEERVRLVAFRYAERLLDASAALH